MNYRALILSLGILSLPFLLFGGVELGIRIAWHFRDPPPCEPEKAHSVWDLRWAATELVRVDRREEAIECLKAAVSLRKWNGSDRSVLLGAFSQVAGKGEGAKLAVQTYTVALESDPDDYDHLVGRGQAYAKLGRFREARLDLDAAIAAHPENAPAYKRRAELLADTGEEEAALEDYTRALERGADEFSLVGRGNLYRRLGRYTEAEDDYLAALEMELLDLQVAWVLKNRGYLKELTGDVEAAMADYGRVLELLPEDAWTLKRVAELTP